MNNRFTLVIEMGNAAMQDNYDIANAIVFVARKIEEEANEPYEFPIHDRNGNKVGTYTRTVGVVCPSCNTPNVSRGPTLRESCTIKPEISKILADYPGLNPDEHYWVCYECHATALDNAMCEHFTYEDLLKAAI